MQAPPPFGGPNGEKHTLRRAELPEPGANSGAFKANAVMSASFRPMRRLSVVGDKGAETRRLRDAPALVVVVTCR